MIILLNLLPYLAAALGAFIAFKLRKVWILLATIAALIIYMKAQPSYMPKGQVERAPVPAMEQTEASIEDRASRPDSLSQRDQRIKEAVRGGLDFKH